MSENTTAYVPTFKTETLPDDFTNVLGAALLSGWGYQVEHSVHNEVVAKIVVLAYHSNVDGTASGKYRDIQLTWEHVGGEWFCDAAGTGYVKKKVGDDGIAVDYKKSDLLVSYMGSHAAEWVFTNLEQPKPKTKGKKKALAIGDGKNTDHAPDDDEAIDVPIVGHVEDEVIDE